MARDIAVVLNNGSLNSAVAAALAAQKHRLVMLYAETSDKPAGRWRWAFEQQVAFFKPYREVAVAMPFLGGMRSAATVWAAMADRRQGGMVAPQLLALLPVAAVAASYAAQYEAAAVYCGTRVGTNVDDLAAATEYFQILTELLQMPCGQTDMEFVAPLLELEEWQVVDLGYQVNAPLDRGWSCLEDAPEPCWTCVGCRAREAAFQQAARPDPLRPVRR